VTKGPNLTVVIYRGVIVYDATRAYDCIRTHIDMMEDLCSRNDERHIGHMRSGGGDRWPVGIGIALSLEFPPDPKITYAMKNRYSWEDKSWCTGRWNWIIIQKNNSPPITKI